MHVSSTTPSYSTGCTLSSLIEFVLLAQNHGYCHTGSVCPASHDIDIILDQQETTRQAKEAKKRRKRKRKSKDKADDQDNDTPSQMQGKSESEGQSVCVSECQTMNSTRDDERRGTLMTGGHRAGFDAFMAGFCLVFMAEMEHGGGMVSWTEGLTDWRNKVTLSGKPVPLVIAKSHFAKPSLYHVQRLTTLTHSD